MIGPELSDSQYSLVGDKIDIGMQIAPMFLAGENGKDCCINQGAPEIRWSHLPFPASNLRSYLVLMRIGPENTRHRENRVRL